MAALALVAVAPRDAHWPRITGVHHDIHELLKNKTENF